MRLSLISFFLFSIFVFLPVVSCAISIVPTIPSKGAGWVELTSTVTYDGNLTPTVIYEYTLNSETYYFIGEAVYNPSDPINKYSVFWNTTLVTSGQYLVKATVSDSKNSASAFRIMEVNNSGADIPIPSVDSGWSKGFATLNYKETLELTYTGRKITPSIDYGSMPQLAKDYFSIDTSYSSVSGGQNKIVIRSLEIPIDRVESENFKGGVYNIELSVGSDVMSISYNLSSVQPSGSSGFSSTIDQRVSSLENRIKNLEARPSGTTVVDGNVNLDNYVTVEQLNNAIKQINNSPSDPANQLYANQLKDYNQSILNLSRNSESMRTDLNKLLSKDNEALFHYAPYLSVVSIAFSLIAIVFTLLAPSNAKSPKAPKSVNPHKPNQKYEPVDTFYQGKKDDVHDIGFIQGNRPKWRQ